MSLTKAEVERLLDFDAVDCEACGLWQRACYLARSFMARCCCAECRCVADDGGLAGDTEGTSEPDRSG